MSRTLKTLVLFFVIQVTSLAFGQDPEEPKPLVITNVNVVDVLRGRVKRDLTVVITDNRITAIGNLRMLRLPAGATIVDGSGKFLIPGLWDMHVHLGTTDLDRDAHLALFLINGVTGIRIMDGEPEHHEWRRQIDAGTLLGPQAAIASALIGFNPISAADAQAEVKRAKVLGADFVKVHDNLSRESYLALVAEARRAKLSVAGHAPLALTAAEVSAAGQRSIEHFTGLDEAKSDERKATALATVLKKNHTWLCPTLIMRLNYASLDDQTKAGDPRLSLVKTPWSSRWLRMTGDAKKTGKAEWENRRSVVNRERALIGLMQRSGVGILAGTDTSNPYVYPGFSLHDELNLLVEAGLSPQHALQTATTNPARFLKNNEVGSIEKGKVANLVLLDANPLADIRNTKKINAVIVNGKFFDRKMLDEMLSQIATKVKGSQ